MMIKLGIGFGIYSFLAIRCVHQALEHGRISVLLHLNSIKHNHSSRSYELPSYLAFPTRVKFPIISYR